MSQRNQKTPSSTPGTVFTGSSIVAGINDYLREVLRLGGYTMIYWPLFEDTRFSWRARWVFVGIISRGRSANLTLIRKEKTQPVFGVEISRRELAKNICLGRRAINKGLAELEDAGIIMTQDFPSEKRMKIIVQSVDIIYPEKADPKNGPITEWDYQNSVRRCGCWFPLLNAVINDSNTKFSALARMVYAIHVRAGNNGKRKPCEGRLLNKTVAQILGLKSRGAVIRATRKLADMGLIVRKPRKIFVQRGWTNVSSETAIPWPTRQYSTQIEELEDAAMAKVKKSVKKGGSGRRRRKI